MYDGVRKFLCTGFREAHEFFRGEFIILLQRINITLDTIETKGVLTYRDDDRVLLVDETNGTAVVCELHL